MSDAAPVSPLRQTIRDLALADEAMRVRDLVAVSALDAADRLAISEAAANLVTRLRDSTSPSLMEGFLAEYSLSTEEGVALMCLAEALLRVPDNATIDALIEDKIGSADWGRHINQSSSPLVNASTWALMLTGKVLSDDADTALIGSLRSVVKRLGEPVVRTAVAEAMKELGRNFVLGRSIEEALKRAAHLEGKGYTYSYDMLGEAARTDADAKRYHLAYSDAITAIAPHCKALSVRDNPGISVKLSALHPRYEEGQRDRVMNRLVPRASALALLAASAGMGFNIDAEEADRLDLSLDVIERLLSDPALNGWDGFGVVVQAYGPRAAPVIDWLYDLAARHDRKIMVRLVKGAYWDTEIKRAQVLGLAGYPVFTRKANTDISYIACARKLIGMSDRIYPQFATHNAHTVSAVLHMAGNDRDRFEFQRLHGMGEDLHQAIMDDSGTRCRIYAPVGAHQDLLAYLVRRLLENGANSSFVNQIVDTSITPDDVARDPMADFAAWGDCIANPNIVAPGELYGPTRKNALGWDLTDPSTLADIHRQRAAFRTIQWSAGEAGNGIGEPVAVTNPAFPTDIVGHVVMAGADAVPLAVSRAEAGFAAWSARTAKDRSDCLRRAADLYERHAAEFFALAAREAGKTLLDGVAEVREAVDFLRYYANEGEALGGQVAPRGIFACISPWNFPLAIFSGQIAAALAAGNAVIAKPAEQTPLIAARAVALLHEAGIPPETLQLLPGDGPTIGRPLLSDPRIAGICFTGSTETAKLIDRQMAGALAADAPLIAETGGLNAMIVDSSALPEQVVRDIVQSAFQSAGQRCSALRMLYLQDDVADGILEMLRGAMDALRLGDPWDLSTDVGPVIDREAQTDLLAYCDRMAAEGRLVHRLDAPETGLFVPPALFRVSGIEALEREVFGPILHVATYRADTIDAVIEAINAKGYGLTFGLHTRIDDRVQHVVDRIEAGNIYVNRNQIGAIVGSQPFGGEGLSGTGPKAGGPFYVRRFARPKPNGKVTGGSDRRIYEGRLLSRADLQAAVDSVSTGPRAAGSGIAHRTATVAGRLGIGMEPDLDRLVEARRSGIELPGPTGESNRLWLYPRGVILCVGDDPDRVLESALSALYLGNAVVALLPMADRVATAQGMIGEAGLAARFLDGRAEADEIAAVSGLAGVFAQYEDTALARLRQALAAGDGPILQPVVPGDAPIRLMLERHVCVDTTAAGGNASLMTAAEA